MTDFVRKNMIVISGTFKPKNGQIGVPSSAEVVIVYTDNSGAKATDTLPMTLGADAVTWSAQWDSSRAKAGDVQWMAHCMGGLVGATQGSFCLKANAANTN